MIDRLTTSEAETIAAGRELAAGLSPGDVVLIDGPLGAGKTAFVRGLAGGLGCDESEVTSPTFTLVQEYHGRHRLQHVDLYRLRPPETDDLGLDELTDDAVLAIEWPDRWSHPPADAIRVTLTPEGESVRRLVVQRPQTPVYRSIR